ncbi:MAG: biotin--[acetyl-CoA-carboxylase] ligase [Acidobacteria bacterium]|nr:biotin--[acetyl-CoA-carboxylase] ligase [Acidobacteriota bacterium]
MTADRLIRHLPTVDSTNDRALELAAAGAPDGSVILADAQTSGRGRRGRSWHSPEGGLYLSYLVRDAGDLPRPALLTLAAGVATARAIREATGLAARLKWPNDVVTDQGARKLAGILAEASGAGSRLEFAVIGVGINVSPATFPPDLAGRASSMANELGRDVDRDALQQALIASLDAEVARLRAGGHAAMLDEWSAASPSARGREVSWRADGAVRHGVTAGVDDEGALIVQTDGGITRLVAGEVVWA